MSLKGKIMKIFCQKYWTVAVIVAIFNTLSIFMASLYGQKIDSGSKKTNSDMMQIDEASFLRDALNAAEKELSMLKRDQVVLKKENIELTKKFIALKNRYEQKSDELRKLQLGVAGAVSRKGIEYVGSWEDCLLRALRMFTGRTQVFVKNTIALCNNLEAVSADGKEGGNIQELREQAEELKKEAEKLIAQKKNNLFGLEKDIKIIDINESLELVVISAGSDDGVAVGLQLYVDFKKRQVPLRIIAVRPKVSAALVLEGEVKEIVPGLIVRSGKRTQK